MGWQNVFASILEAGNTTVINAAGIFVYAGNPALGNLIVSIATAAGVDPYGNVYPQGLNVTQGQISGNDYIINAAGIFIYSGTPAAGNLIISMAGAAGVDAFGNAYPEGIDVKLGTISGTTISSSSFMGTDFIINANGIWMYSGTPAFGNLTTALVNPNGTTIDPFGNTSPAGYSSQDPIFLGPFSATPISSSGIATLYSTNGDLQVVDGADLEPYGTQRRSLVVNANIPITGAAGAWQAIAQTSVAGAASGANRTYRVSGCVTISPSQAAGQMQVEWSNPGGWTPSTPSRLSFLWAANGAEPVAVASGVNIGVNAAFNPGFTMANGALYQVLINGTFIVPVLESGVFEINFAPVTSGDGFLVLAGSYVDIMPV